MQVVHALRTIELEELDGVELNGEPFKPKPIVLWFKRTTFDEWPETKAMVDPRLKRYKGAFHELLTSLQPSAIMFEHLQPKDQFVTMHRAMYVPYNLSMSLWDDEAVFRDR